MFLRPFALLSILFLALACGPPEDIGLGPNLPAAISLLSAAEQKELAELLQAGGLHETERSRFVELAVKPNLSPAEREQKEKLEKKLQEALNKEPTSADQQQTKLTELLKKLRGSSGTKTGTAQKSKNLQSILQDGTLPTPSELAAYDQATADILSPLAGNTAKKLGIIYVTEAGKGTQDGSSWENAYAAAKLKTAIDSAGTAANEQKPYLVMVAEGSYAISETLSMKKHVAIMGGFSGNGVDRGGTTTLDGGGNTRVFFNIRLDNTAVLSGVTISNGLTNLNGGGMFNNESSPTLSHVVFSGNTASDGGGMSNADSSPTLSHVTFSGNTATEKGGGMRNSQSSPTLSHVTFSKNTAKQLGGGMANSGSSPTLTNVTFSGNTAKELGGGMANSDSSPTTTNVEYSGNTAKKNPDRYDYSSEMPGGPDLGAFASGGTAP